MVSCMSRKQTSSEKEDIRVVCTRGCRDADGYNRMNVRLGQKAEAVLGLQVQYCRCEKKEDRSFLLACLLHRTEASSSQLYTTSDVPLLSTVLLNITYVQRCNVDVVYYCLKCMKGASLFLLDTPSYKRGMCFAFALNAFFAKFSLGHFTFMKMYCPLANSEA